MPAQTARPHYHGPGHGVKAISGNGSLHRVAPIAPATKTRVSSVTERMPHRTHLPSLALGLTLLASAGCASRATPVAAPHVTAAPALRAAPLTFTHSGRVECSLAADGAITLDGHPWARIDGARIVSTDGHELARIDGNTVNFRGSREGAVLDADGSLRGPDGQRLSLDPAGHPTFTSPDHPGDMVQLETRIDGVTDTTRPTAMVILGALMMRSREFRADPPASP